ncbi:MAG: PTS ascorbate transporter subunit IIC [Eubacteriales bacterium]
MNDNQKKQIPLRLSEKLYSAIAAWAEDDFRSVNGQIEYLLTECVRQRKKNGKYVSDELDKPLDIELGNISAKK